MSSPSLFGIGYFGRLFMAQQHMPELGAVANETLEYMSNGMTAKHLTYNNDFHCDENNDDELHPMC